MSRTATTCLAAALLVAGGLLLGACAGPKSSVCVHPEKLDAPPICTSCHDADRAPCDHDGSWMQNHKTAAVREQRTCETCHKPSYCADCHGMKEEIKPSDKRTGSRFDAATPHRGDYLTQHKVDGRTDPASCLPCHGRKNDGRCRVCHR